MIEANDIKLNEEDLDVMFLNGDFRIGECTEQNQHVIILAAQGDFKQFPSLGVDIEGYLLGERPGNLKENIRKNLVADGMVIDQLSLDETGNLKIESHYE